MKRDYQAREFKTIEGKTGDLIVKAAAIDGPNQGLVAWQVRLEGKTYCAWVPAAEATRKRLDRFILHFRFNPEWRKHFCTPLSTINQVTVTLSDGITVAVDHGMAHYVKALIAAGCDVEEACQGDFLPNGRAASIVFRSTIPEDLEQAANAVGWLGLDRSITPTISRGWAHEYNQLLHLLLDDWLNDDVDRTGYRYVLNREPLPLMPDWPDLPPEAKAEHQRNLRKDVKRVNELDTRATFHDLVGLLSGRDQYSLMSLDKLRSHCQADSFLSYLEDQIQDKTALARALRWRLRGLNLDLVMRKTQAEAVLNERAEIRRTEYRLRKAGDAVMAQS